MTRPLPKPAETAMLATAVFEPSGAHRLVVYLPRIGREVPLTRDEVAQLEEKIASFKRLVIFEDGRTVERLSKYSEAL